MLAWPLGGDSRPHCFRGDGEDGDSRVVLRDMAMQAISVQLGGDVGDSHTVEYILHTKIIFLLISTIWRIDITNNETIGYIY